MSKLTDRQAIILLRLQELHEEGLKSDYHNPFAMTAFNLAGEGAGAAGLIKRGLMIERNGLFYITEDGIREIDGWSEGPVPMTLHHD